MPEKKNIFERHPSITLIITTLVLLIMIDFIAGLILIPGNKNNFRRMHPYYHHGLIPNKHARTSWDGQTYYDMYTNSLGFRDKNIREIPLQSDKERILLIGDSHTEGVGLQYEETFAGKLEKHIDKTKTEILNAGVVGYSPKLYFLKTEYLLKNVGLEFDKLIVFIDISDIQNELVYAHYEPGNEKVKEDDFSKWIKRNSFIIYAINKISYDKKKKRFYELRNKLKENPRTDLYFTFFSDFHDDELLQNEEFHTIGTWYLDRAIFEKWGREGMILEKWHMQKIHELCRENGIELIVSIHPWPMQIVAGDRNSIQVQFWEKFCTDRQLTFINLFETFFGLLPETNVVEEFYLPGDVHFNEKGHEIIAREVARHLGKFPD